MRKDFEEYLERGLEIRRLSMPPVREEGEKRSMYQLFRENFAQIKPLLQKSRTLLDHEIYQPLRNPAKLRKECAGEMIEFSDALADTHTLEIIDMRLALLIVNGLLPYYRARKNADVKKYIHCLFRRLALSYNVAQNFDISELVGDLTEEHRDTVIACADEGLPLIENAKVFASLPPESRQELVTIQLFRATGYERSYYSEKLVRAQLSSYEKCLALFPRPDIQKAAPEVVELFDQPELQEKAETLLTETREALYRDVFRWKSL